jgi:hypothetical protein
MTEAAAVYHDESSRAEIKRHLERVIARREDCPNLNWDRLWNDLELAAEVYNGSLRSLSSASSSISQTIAGFRDCLKLIEILELKLKAPALSNWDFIFDSNGQFSRLSKREPPKLSYVFALRERIMTEATKLREFTAGRNIRVYNKEDCVAEFKARIIEIGQQLLGPAVGRSDGPLITFVHLGLMPVLGDATPDNDALRAFAQRHKKDWLGVNTSS